MPAIGSKRQVFSGFADHTSGGLRRGDLMRNRHGRIVSKKKHMLGKIAFKRNGLVPKSAAALAALRKK